MDKSKDPILEGKGEVGTSAGETKPFIEGLYITSLNKEQLKTMGDFFNDLYQKISKKRSRQITRNAYTMLRGAIFALGSRTVDNIEWKEHCAGSLREIIHEWDGNGYSFTSEFREIYPNSPKSEKTDAYKNISLHYQYFSGIAHHNASGIMGALRAIKKDSSLKLKDCYQDDVFAERVNFFLGLLEQIISFSKQPTIKN